MSFLNRTTFGRFKRWVTGLGITFAVVVLAVLGVSLGSSELTRRAEAVPAPDAAPETPVSATPIAVDPGYAVNRVFIGQVEAQRAVNISFELGGKLNRILVDEGDAIKSGQLLASLDTSLLEAERDRLTASRSALAAQLQFANTTVERSAKLSQRGHASQARLDEAIARRDELQSRIDETGAALHNVGLRIGKSEIHAPFAGRVTMRNADGGETLRLGEPVLGLVEAATPQVRIGVPLDVDPDVLETVEIEIGSQRYAASLLSLRPDIDPRTRTRTALFAISDDVDVAFGQTARLYVEDYVDSAGTWVPVTALKEGMRGQWTLLVADAQRIVRNATVEVLQAQGDRVFVRGVFPAGTMLIDQGPQRVTIGQRVAIKAPE